VTGEELTRIAQAAQAKDMTVSDFIRRATLAAIENDTPIADPETLAEIRAKMRELSAALEKLAG
jgi:hypothetical protein